MKKIVLSFWVFLAVFAIAASVLHFFGIARYGLKTEIAFGVLCGIAYAVTVYAAVRTSNKKSKNLKSILKDIITND